jgi:murein DD-endopeptidase MepM/ murein hydrolase activator NlpD
LKRGFPDKVKHSSAYGAVHRGSFTYGGVAPVKQSEVQRPSLALVLNSTASESLQADVPDFLFLNERVPIPSIENNNRHRRVRTSAAMVGLALSVGSSDLLSLWNTKGVLAAEATPTLEPLQNWSAPDSSSDSLAAMGNSSLPQAIVSPILQVEDVSFSAVEPSASAPAFDLSDYYPHELFTHQVAETETLWSIAQQYGIEAEILASLNHLTVESPLQVGQVLQFPRVFITKTIAPESQNLAAVADEKPIVKSELLSLDINADVKGGQKVALADPSIPLEIKPSAVQEENVPIAFLPETQTSDVGLADLVPYRVQSGDTLDKIARTYEVARATLVAVNQIENPNLLKVDQVIGIPRANAGLKLALVPEASTSDQTNVPVLSSIQPQTEPQAVEENPPVSPDLISAVRQDTSRFPYEPTNPLSGELSYQVRPGDTLSKISRRYGLPMADLIQANRIANPNVIRVNQSLIIPSHTANVIALASDQAVQVASNPATPSLELGQPQAPQAIREQVAVQDALQVNTAVIPTVPSLESIVQEPISLPRPAASVAPSEVPQVAVASLTVTTPFIPSAGATIPEVLEPAAVQTPSSKNDYVSRLLMEVNTLREQYRNGQINETAAEPVAPAPVAAVPVQAASTTTAPTVPALQQSGISSLSSRDRINPEFNPQAYSSPGPAMTTDSTQILAAAPVGSSNYEPLVQSLVGQTVSPALPSLSADPYLPKDRAVAGYMWPAQGVLTSGYGWRWGRMHKGIDIAAPIGTPIVAAAPGEVITAGWNSGGYGYLVEVRHDDGSITLYAHNNRILVQKGQYVSQGQQLAEMGSTGYSTGPHLHFEIHPAGDGAVNPMAYLPQ